MTAFAPLARFPTPSPGLHLASPTFRLHLPSTAFPVTSYHTKYCVHAHAFSELNAVNLERHKEEQIPQCTRVLERPVWASPQFALSHRAGTCSDSPAAVSR